MAAIGEVSLGAFLLLAAEVWFCVVRVGEEEDEADGTPPPKRRGAAVDGTTTVGVEIWLLDDVIDDTRDGTAGPPLWE